jgi:tripartite-type tricarboxylate transporter receptor subunit TctC
MQRSICLVAIFASLAASAGTAAADDFYRGKTIRLIVPSAPGGGYDAYGRTLIQFMRKHIPGEPSIVVQNMPGGGGLQAANWIYNIASKDGLTFGLLQRGTPFYPYFGDDKAKFVPQNFTWLGSISGEAGTATIWHTSKVKTMDDAFKTVVLMGGSGPNDSETYTNLMNNTIGTKFRIVQGYKANSAVLLAMERGEVEGVTGSWSSMKTQRPKWIKDKLVRMIVQVARTKQPDLPDVPLIMEFVKTDEGRAMWNVMLRMAEVGRPVAAPPGIPAEAAKILETAFEATIKDEGFIAEMVRTGREVTPENGAAMQRALAEVSKQPKPLLTKLIDYTRHSEVK